MQRLFVHMFNVQKLIGAKLQLILLYNLSIHYNYAYSLLFCFCLYKFSLPQFAFYLLCFVLLNLYFTFCFQFALLLHNSYLFLHFNYLV